MARLRLDEIYLVVDSKPRRERVPDKLETNQKSIAVTENELGLAERTTAMLKRKQEKGKRPRAAKYCTSGCSARNETSQLPQTNEYTDEYAILMGQSEKNKF